MIFSSIRRVGFETHVCLFGDLRLFKDTQQQLFEIGSAEKSGRASAKMKFSDARLSSEKVQIHLPFLQYRFHVWRFYLMIHCDTRVAGAIRAKALAKGEVNVQGDALFGVAGIEAALYMQLPVFCAKVVFPGRNGGIAGVAGNRYVIFLKKVQVLSR